MVGKLFVLPGGYEHKNPYRKENISLKACSTEMGEALVYINAPLKNKAGGQAK